METVRVRQSAFMVMLSWNPSLDWWMRIATSTWREKSADMISLISSTIERVSHLEDYKNNEQ